MIVGDFFMMDVVVHILSHISLLLFALIRRLGFCWETHALLEWKVGVTIDTAVQACGCVASPRGTEQLEAQVESKQLDVLTLDCLASLGGTEGIEALILVKKTKNISS